MQHSVFPRGARVRPRLCLAVAAACGDDDPAITDIAAASIELLHCASLVHDDLPCFDDAAIRDAGCRPCIAFGEPLAVLAGDALIVLAFQNLARAAIRAAAHERAAVDHRARRRRPGGHRRRPGLGMRAARSISRNIIAPRPDRCFPQRPAPAPPPPEPIPIAWRMLGETLGEAYQVADDLRDAVAIPTRSASRSAGTLRSAARAQRENSASRARCRGLNNWCKRRSPRSRRAAAPAICGR